MCCTEQIRATTVNVVDGDLQEEVNVMMRGEGAGRYLSEGIRLRRARSGERVLGDENKDAGHASDGREGGDGEAPC